MIKLHTPVPIRISKFSVRSSNLNVVGWNILGKLGTEVPKSSMGSFDPGGGGGGGGGEIGPEVHRSSMRSSNLRGAGVFLVSSELKSLSHP